MISGISWFTRGCQGNCPSDHIEEIKDEKYRTYISYCKGEFCNVGDGLHEIGNFYYNKRSV